MAIALMKYMSNSTSKILQGQFADFNKLLHTSYYGILEKKCDH